MALADSLAMPRVENGEVLHWEETWPHLVERHLLASGLDVEVINCGARARTSDRLLGDDFTEHVVFKHPNIAIVQVGITDCSPRVLSRMEKRILNFPGFPAQLRNSIIRRRSAHRKEITGRDPLKRVYTPPARFERDLSTFFEGIRRLDWAVRVVLLPIVSHRARMEEKSPGHGGNVDRYNAILFATAKDNSASFVEPQRLLPPEHAPADAYFFRDGYHLSPVGSARFATELARVLENILKGSGALQGE